MIRIERGPEPEGLAGLRNKEVDRLRQVPQPSAETIGDSYRAFAGSLRRQQRFKCCYCELFVRVKFNDVEHFRPKASADRRPCTAASYGYWWLAWTWENLLFACPNCNRSGKNDRFPLAPGSIPLVPEQQPPGDEVSLLIDPCTEDPLAAIQFVEQPDTPGRFFPKGREDSRGQMTVDCCGLDSDDLLDLYEVHFEGLAPKIDAVRAAMAAGDQDRVERRWQELCRELEPFRSFLALTYDIIDQRFPQQLRQSWNLLLPRPEIKLSR